MLAASSSSSVRILTINGGSSSIKFAVFDSSDPPRRLLGGEIERIGRPGANIRVKSEKPEESFLRSMEVPDQATAVGALLAWVEQRKGTDALTAVGHRVVHGGPKYSQPQRITEQMVAELHRLSAYDPAHLLMEAFRRRFPHLPQVACFDTAFHHDLPRVARLLPIPRRYDALEIRRYGFHGLVLCVLDGGTRNASPGWKRRGGGSSSPTSAMARASRRYTTGSPSTRAWASRRPPAFR